MHTRFLLPLLALPLAGCLAGHTAETSSPPATVPTTVAVQTATAAVGPGMTIPDTLDRYIERQMRERRIPGLALAITRNGQVLTQRGYGLASVENSVPVTPATRFALASITKQFTTAGVMMLAEQGKIDLDASITRYLPDAPRNWEPVTVRHLMTHTSGMPPIGEGFSGDTGGIYNRIWTSAEEEYAAARADTLWTRPGERYAYSDVGFFLLGMITQHVSGVSWRQFMRERFFEPLGMTETFVIDHVGMHPNLASGYTLRNSALSHLHRPWQFELPSHFGIFSTVGDLAKWDAALYTDRLLSEGSRRQMWTPVRLNDGSSYPYGFGWQVERPGGHTLLRHTGITGTEIVRLPDDTVAVIVLTNLGRGFGGEANSWGIAREVAGMLIPAIRPAKAAMQEAAPAPPATRTDAALTAKLNRLVWGFGGEVGIYARHLPTGASAAIRADEVFPTASLIKLPILLTLYDQAEQGRVDLNAQLPYPDTLHYRWVESTDVVGHMEPGDSLPLSELAFLMLSVSDNVASLWIQALVGGGAAVNEWLAEHGFEQTRVNSRTPGREEAQKTYGWGQTTPREIAQALVMIREGRAVSTRAADGMYRMLTNSYWNKEALSQIPPTVQAASKQGFVDRSRSEVLLVNAPSGDYVLAVITKKQTDTRYGAANEGGQLIRAVSRAVYEHFNPNDPWRPLP